MRTHWDREKYPARHYRFARSRSVPLCCDEIRGRGKLRRLAESEGRNFEDLHPVTCRRRRVEGFCGSQNKLSSGSTPGIAEMRKPVIHSTLASCAVSSSGCGEGTARSEGCASSRSRRFRVDRRPPIAPAWRHASRLMWKYSCWSKQIILIAIRWWTARVRSHN
jgi:hypothetical protein